MSPTFSPNLVLVVTTSVLLTLISLSSGRIKFAPHNVNAYINEDTTTCPDFACPKVLCDLKRKNVQNFCENVQCVGIEVENCTENNAAGAGRTMYEEKLTMCGCCPGCVKYKGVGEECEQYPPPPSPDPECTDQFCKVLMNTCAPGLICPLVGHNEKKCSYKSTLTGGFSELTSCHDKRALAFSNDLYWTPRCEEDESYSPKQCKGSYSGGICFCVSKEGRRIFGTEYQRQAQNQTCACSRQVHELRESGHIASFHCTPDGNYEPLQCDTESGLCYCVEPKTGKMTGAVLPENEWKNLPCFSLNLTNFNPELGYYRVCESEWAPAQKLSLEASLHGLKVLSGRRLNCDFDGSYAPVQNMDQLTKCVNKDGTLIGAYRDSEDKHDTDCQCVRDEIKSWQEGIPFMKRCADITGNYDVISPIDQTAPQHWRCVDRDGIFFGEDIVEDQYKCCLYGNLPTYPPRNCDKEPINVKQKCYDPTMSDEWNKDKIRPCYFWAT
ncbi:uncharacterized protein LOC110848902 [Folsomia candida]|uniref:Equistatin n=1 Tax=Folsomia candida TaxID=158441 RepID=A0A226EDL9_FOLCA|nr:uncharacterized protein LOC110848902 [Folsomia candida]OXA55675.1 Equistatin [Folsomia candida]